MFDVFLERLRQGYRTMQIPGQGGPGRAFVASVPGRFRGAPLRERSSCDAGCAACSEACPTGALTSHSLDLGKCLFCVECERACSRGALSFSRDWRLATSSRDALRMKGERGPGAAPDGQGELPPASAGELAAARGLEAAPVRLATALGKGILGRFKRSLRLRQVSAGGCNACEADANVLSTIGWDMGRFGIQFVASPRHADGLLVTGPVTRNMRLALEKTWQAVPSPRIVIAVGACAISGGPYCGSEECFDGVTEILPVDLFVPGCPPHPLTLLDGLLRMLGRIEWRGRLPER